MKQNDFMSISKYEIRFGQKREVYMMVKRGVLLLYKRALISNVSIDSFQQLVKSLSFLASNSHKISWHYHHQNFGPYFGKNLLEAFLAIWCSVAKQQYI